VLAQANEYPFGEDFCALRGVMDVVVSEERTVLSLPLAEQRQQIDDREAVLRTEGLEDLEGPLRREQLRGYSCCLATGRRGGRADLVSIGIGDEDEARAETSGHMTASGS